MQIGLTWPLQWLLKVSVPYGDPIDRGLCWDAHCITLKHLSKLPPEQPEEQAPVGPDLSALEEFLSDLPEVEDEE